MSQSTCTNITTGENTGYIGTLLATVRTDDGCKLAWVMNTTRTGDRLAFICGTPMPFVLRAQGTGQDETWQLLGDAQVNRLQEWQAMGLPDSLKDAYEQQIMSALPDLTPLRQRVARAWRWDFLVADGWEGARLGESLLTSWERIHLSWLTLV